MSGTILLIIPCYNESARLPLAAFKENTSIDVIFVDDGSSDNTAEILQTYFAASPHREVLKLPHNHGKAEAVRQGILSALKQNRPDLQWIGFWDADLSTSLQEVPHFLQFQKDFMPAATSIWGSRVYRLGATIRRSSLRHYLGRLFATIISHALQIEAYDTQCGAKLFKPEVARIAFAEPFISRWIFDIEILLRIGQEKVLEYPLTRWQDIPGSKVKIAHEAFRILKDIFLIRKKYLKH